MLLKSFRPTAVLFSSDNCRTKIKQLGQVSAYWMGMRMSDEREIIVGRIDFSINNNS